MTAPKKTIKHKGHDKHTGKTKEVSFVSLREARKAFVYFVFDDFFL